MPESSAEQLRYTLLEETPLGPLCLSGDSAGLRHLQFVSRQGRANFSGPGVPGERSDGDFRDAVRQLRLYFERRLREFSLPLAPRGTDFQRRVWAALQRVSWGRTASYGEVAAAIGQPSACRAVGLANSRNPLPIFIPCHRVIGSDRSLTGYAGGLERKRILLSLEQE